MTKEISKFESSKIRRKNKAIQIIQVLNVDTIDMDKLRELSFTGVPEIIAGVRPIVWRVINGGLPLNTSEWKSQIE